MSNKIKVIVIVGPTASGKTKYSIDLAKKLDGEIISADSRLVYKGFDIGTAKPSTDEMDSIPHYMIDIVEPTFDYSAGLYKQMAAEIIEQIARKGKTPIVVGGTGLYIDILLKSFDLPEIAPDYKLREKLGNLSNEDLYEILKENDPQGAQSIEFNDKKKLIRAIEIVTLTGKTLDESRGISDSPYEIEWIGKNFDREILYQRINTRVEQMANNGLIEETRTLLNKYGRIYNLVNTIGYREILHYLDGDITLDDSIDLLKKNTRHYAKRQLTWFRKNPEIKWDVYPEKLEK